jgi:hypothetical protein
LNAALRPTVSFGLLSGFSVLVAAILLAVLPRKGRVR